ncbi:MAG: FAD-dependent monooxygenase, partial [Pseudomonadota bacterium]
MQDEIFDAVIVGGGPSGATAAHCLASAGKRVALLDRDGRIKPCGGAVPPRLVRDYAIPDALLVAKVRAARVISPKGAEVEMPIDGGYVGMVDRDTFDEWLRLRAAEAGAVRFAGTFEALERDSDGSVHVRYRDKSLGERAHIRTRLVVGADGARSTVAARHLLTGDSG